MLSLLLLACSTEVTPPTTTAEAPVESPVEALAELAPEGEWTHYGAIFTEQQVVSAKDLLADPAAHVDQEILIEGRVTEVCKKQGCWMVIADEGRTMRVMMKDHAFSVDKQGAGDDCRVQGTVIAKTIDPGVVQHLAEESVRPDQMPEAGKAAGTVIYQVEATGVAFRSPEA